jgi:hypothetical protein
MISRESAAPTFTGRSSTQHSPSWLVPTPSLPPHSAVRSAASQYPGPASCAAVHALFTAEGKGGSDDGSCDVADEECAGGGGRRLTVSSSGAPRTTLARSSARNLRSS